MLRRLTIAGALALMLGTVPMFGQASVPPQGCAAGGGMDVGNGSTIEGEPGGFIIAGDGVVTVTRSTPDGEITITYDASDGVEGSGVSPVGNGDILEGDRVSCSATAGIAAAGNPEP